MAAPPTLRRWRRERTQEANASLEISGTELHGVKECTCGHEKGTGGARDPHYKLRRLPSIVLPPRTTSGGASAPPKAPPSKGYSRKGGGRLETRLRELRDQSKLSISDGDIELLQRISNVETGGCLQALNSWDDVYMSIGFMQWPLVFGKLQRLIARAPEAFRRYGIELDSGRTYTIKRRGYIHPFMPIALKGVTHPNELRSLEWGKRFFAAGLDPEIVAREAELALEIIAEERRKIEKSSGRAIPHYDEFEPASRADPGDKQSSPGVAQDFVEASSQAIRQLRCFDPRGVPRSGARGDSRVLPCGGKSSRHQEKI